MLSLCTVLCATVVQPRVKAPPSVDFPGVDVLSAGYDDATWKTSSGAKYQIWDLSEAASTPVFIPSLNRTFTPPAFVSVNADGPSLMRVEDSCEGVATDFASYLKTYQSRTSFDVGIATKSFKLL